MEAEAEARARREQREAKAAKERAVFSPSVGGGGGAPPPQSGGGGGGGGGGGAQPADHDATYATSCKKGGQKLQTINYNRKHPKAGQPWEWSIPTLRERP